jgi:hypothetical protein
MSVRALELLRVSLQSMGPKTKNKQSAFFHYPSFFPSFLA